MRRKLVVLLVGIVILLLSGCGCDHEYDEGVVTTEPTCVDTGVKTFTCTKCGDIGRLLLDTMRHRFSILPHGSYSMRTSKIWIVAIM